MALAAAPAVASAGTVQVTVNGGSPVSIDAASAPENDIIERNYTVLGAVGGPHVFAKNGFSAAALLAAVDVGPGAVTSFRVKNADGSWIVLSGHEAACRVDVAGCPFPDGPSFFYFDGLGADASANFWRPQRTATDLNIADRPSLPEIDVEVLTGPLLTVTATASPAHATAGKPVALGATVSNQLSGENLSYAWDFKDGHTSTARSPSHVFTKAGTYRASVTVSGDLGSSGASTVTVRVGNRAGAPSPGGGNQDGPKQEGAPNGSNGGTNPTGGSGGNTGGTAQANAPQPPAASTKPPPPAATGDPVTGVLLAGSTTLPTQQAQAAAAAGEAGSQAPGAGLPTALVGVGAGILLLAAGAGGELRGLRRRVAG